MRRRKQQAARNSTSPSASRSSPRAANSRPTYISGSDRERHGRISAGTRRGSWGCACVGDGEGGGRGGDGRLSRREVMVVEEWIGRIEVGS